VAVLTALAAALPFLLRLAAHPATLAEPGSLAGLAALAVFVALLWVPDPVADGDCRRSVLALAVMAVAGIALVYLWRSTLLGVLPVIVAAGVGGVLPLRRALVWVGVQSAALAPVFVGSFGAGDGALVVAAFAGFQLFAVYASQVAARERRGRQELVRTNAELSATRELLAESSRAGERLRIARDLHDVLGHHLTALSLALEAARHAVPEERSRHVETARGLARGVLAEVRRAVGRLREEEAEVDLATALAALAEGAGRPVVHLAVPDELRRLPDPEHAAALVRCAGEIITNARRHSGAANLWLEVVREGGGIALAARDDGRGADGAAGREGGFGLVGMRERLEHLGGRLSLDAAPGAGFRVRAWLPGPAA
jgi:signal transduction histidine kinase